MNGKFKCTRFGLFQFLACGLTIVCIPTFIAAQDFDRCLCLEKIAENLRLPVSLVSAYDGSNRMFVAEQFGQVHIFYPDGTKLPEPFVDISSRIGPLPKVSEEGIADIAFHPNFRLNGLFYMLFSTPGKGNVDNYSNLAEFKVSTTDINKADPDYFRQLLQIAQPNWPHNAEKLLFGIDDYLYIFIGDGGRQRDPDRFTQNMKTHLGKVLRIDVDSRTDDFPYGIPEDNPFLDPLPDGTFAQPEIYAFGFRNPWRCGMDAGHRETEEGRGRMICGDVGQHSVEELNLIEKGGNFGWNVKEGTQIHCSKCPLAPVGHLVDPIFSYHRNKQIGKAVIGGQFYRGCLYPELDGVFLWGDFYSGLLFRLVQNNATGDWENKELEMCSSSVCKHPLQSSYASKIVSFGLDENGEVYLLSVTNTNPSKKSGYIYRFVDPIVQQDQETCELEFAQKAAALRQSNVKPSLAQNADPVIGFETSGIENTNQVIAASEESDPTTTTSSPTTTTTPTTTTAPTSTITPSTTTTTTTITSTPAPTTTAIPTSTIPSSTTTTSTPETSTTASTTTTPPTSTITSSTTTSSAPTTSTAAPTTATASASTIPITSKTEPTTSATTSTSHTTTLVTTSQMATTTLTPAFAALPTTTQPSAATPTTTGTTTQPNAPTSNISPNVTVQSTSTTMTTSTAQPASEDAGEVSLLGEKNLDNTNSNTTSSTPQILTTTTTATLITIATSSNTSTAKTATSTFPTTQPTFTPRVTATSITATSSATVTSSPLIPEATSAQGETETVETESTSEVLSSTTNSGTGTSMTSSVATGPITTTTAKSTTGNASLNIVHAETPTFISENQNYYNFLLQLVRAARIQAGAISTTPSVDSTAVRNTITLTKTPGSAQTTESSTLSEIVSRSSEVSSTSPILSSTITSSAEIQADITSVPTTQPNNVSGLQPVDEQDFTVKTTSESVTEVSSLLNTASTGQLGQIPHGVSTVSPDKMIASEESTSSAEEIIEATSEATYTEKSTAALSSDATTTVTSETTTTLFNDVTTAMTSLPTNTNTAETITITEASTSPPPAAASNSNTGSNIVPAAIVLPQTGQINSGQPSISTIVKLFPFGSIKIPLQPLENQVNADSSSDEEPDDD